MHDPARLAPALRAAAPEIYLYDCASLQLLDANDAACDNLQYARKELLAMTPYLATIIVLALISRNPRWIRLNMPASLGKPFHPDG